MIPVFQILYNNVPKDSQKVRASKNDDDQLDHSVELHDQKGSQNGVWDVKVVVADIVIQLVVVILIYYLLELLHVEKLCKSWQPEHLKQTEESHPILVNALTSRVQDHILNWETSC